MPISKDASSSSGVARVGYSKTYFAVIVFFVLMKRSGKQELGSGAVTVAVVQAASVAFDR
jgi:hypothetical protein